MAVLRFLNRLEIEVVKKDRMGSVKKPPRQISRQTLNRATILNRQNWAKKYVN